MSTVRQELPSVKTSHFSEEYWRVLVRSAGASFCNIAITFPINKVMFRQQAEGHTISLAVDNLRKEGIRKLYRGIVPPLMQKSVSIALMFGIYDSVSTSLHRKRGYSQSASNGSAALIAGTVEALLTPFERVQVLLQSRKFSNVVYSTRHAFTALAEFGIKEYYRGFSAVLLRNGPSNVLFFSSREYISTIWPSSSDTSDFDVLFRNFINGAALGAFISGVFHPVNVARISMQDRIGGSFKSFAWSLYHLYKTRGIVAMYRGVSVNATRACISWGIINSTYEYLKKFI